MIDSGIMWEWKSLNEVQRENVCQCLSPRVIDRKFYSLCVTNTMVFVSKIVSMNFAIFLPVFLKVNSVFHWHHRIIVEGEDESFGVD